MLKYFSGSFVFMFFGLIASYFVGQYYGGTFQAGLQALFIASVLAVLEISLSFDNAIVNAVVLKEMTPTWQHRFLTWGMVIAVFGMRLIFPLAIVSTMAWINPWEALVLASTRPDDYAQLMLAAHTQVSAFGGSFLLMVSLKYFYDAKKDVHWIPWIEKPVNYLGRKIESIEICLLLLILVSLTVLLPNAEQLSYLKAGMYGLIVYVLVDAVGTFLGGSEDTVRDIHKASAGMFLYLEVLDASFSFDGVIGAFAITHNLFIIMIGLSIGAFFVRSLTIMFVEKEALESFLYLEHGAFYAIGILAMIMLGGPFVHIPEWVTGLTGAVVIVASFLWSLRARHRVRA